MISFISAKFSNLVTDEQNVCVRWEYHDKKINIDFSGVLYIQLGCHEFQFHQGRDNNIEKKKTRILLGKKFILGQDHYFLKTICMTQATKKLDFPVTFSVKKKFHLTDFKINGKKKKEMLLKT